jgi:RNA polymerase sigma-70 factor, ECF subfamily
MSALSAVPRFDNVQCLTPMMPHVPAARLVPRAAAAYDAEDRCRGLKAYGARVIADEAKARFRALVLPHLDEALTLARWLTGSRTDAEDVTQDAMLRALRAMEGFRGDAPRAWLLAITRNTAMTWLRRNRPAALVPVEDVAEAEAASPLAAEARQAAPTPETPLMRAETSARVRAALEKLPFEFREIVVLRDVEDLSYRDIAQALDIPVGTVMSRLARGRARLAALLKDELR